MFCQPVFEFLPASSVNLCVLRRVNPICFCDTDVFLVALPETQNSEVRFVVQFTSVHTLFCSVHQKPSITVPSSIEKWANAW